jgi:hypothetical protein
MANHRALHETYLEMTWIRVGPLLRRSDGREAIGSFVSAFIDKNDKLP